MSTPFHKSSLREFANIEPLNFWFEYPIHRIDANGELDAAHTQGSLEAARAKNKKYTTPEERKASLESAFEACSIELPVTIAAMAEYIGVTDRCVRDRLKEFKNDFWTKNGTVGRKEHQ